MRMALLLMALYLRSPLPAARADDCSVAAISEAPPSKYCEQRGPTESYLANALGMHQRLLGIPEVKASYQAFLDGLKELEAIRKTLCEKRKKLRALPANADACPTQQSIFAAEDAGKDLSAYAAEVRSAYSNFEEKWKAKHERMGRLAIQAVAGSQHRQFSGHLERELERNNFNQDRFREGLNAYERVLDQLYLEHNLHSTYKAAAERLRACLQKKRDACAPEDRPFGR